MVWPKAILQRKVTLMKLAGLKIPRYQEIERAKKVGGAGGSKYDLGKTNDDRSPGLS